MKGNVKTCACGRSFGSKGWNLLDYVGIHKDEPPHPDLELRNCICGSTIAVAMPTDEFFAAKIDKNKRGCA